MARRGNQEGSIAWRPTEGRWRGQMMLSGRRASFYGATRKAVLDQFEKAREVHALGLPANAGKQLLAQFLERWLEDSVKVRCRPRTYVLYKQQVAAHIVPTIGHIALDKLTPQAIQQRLITAKLAEGLQGQTVRHIRAVLRSALSQAEKWLLVPRNVAKLTEAPRKRRTEVHIFAPEQAHLFVGGPAQAIDWVRCTCRCWPLVCALARRSASSGRTPTWRSARSSSAARSNEFEWKLARQSSVLLSQRAIPAIASSPFRRASRRF